MSGPVGATDAPPDVAECGQPEGPTIELLPSRVASVGGLEVRRALPRRQRRTIGAWCFADHFGPVTPAGPGGGIQVGDLVVTSGAGGVFPRGIPVGRVRAIDDRGSALFHYAVLTPVVDFARVDEVLLLTGDTRRDVATAFPSDG